MVALSVPLNCDKINNYCCLAVAVCMLKGCVVFP